MARTYTVIYRTGGTENFRWDKTLVRHSRRDSAQTMADDLKRMGYAALIHDTDRLEAIGLPETYGPDAMWQVSATLEPTP